MTTVKNQDRILEAIDQLRRRKARPDIQRICNYLFRRFSINSAEARRDLQWCVENDIVLKVEYKGSISYRNAAKKFTHNKQQQQQRDNNDNSTTSTATTTTTTTTVVSTSDNTNNNNNNNSNNNKVGSANNNNRKFGQLLTNAFSELIVNDPDYLELGVPADEIINNILSKDSVRYTKNYISILIEKEVENGGLIKMENNNYLMGPSSPKKKSKKLQEDEKKSTETGLRVGGRRKRAKKVFDPSDTHIPKKRGRPAGSLNKTTIEKQMAKLSGDDSRPESRTSNGNSRDQFGVCSVCHSTNKKGLNDRLIACRECSNKAHFSCLNGEDMMLRMHPDNTWQCPYCKTCVVCYETSNAGNLIVCAVCADAYHVSCHEPRISEKIKPNMRWLCINCEMPDELKINEIQSNISFSQKTNTSNEVHDITSSPSVSHTSTPYQSPPLSPTPPQLSPQAPSGPILSHHQNGGNDSGNGSSGGGIINNCSGDNYSDSPSNKDSDDDNIDPSIPDATNWSYEDVYQYFVQYFPKEAKIFREQEIDGRSLLLLKRVDVLTNLKLKLGPALKIYKHVVKLQVRRDDPKMYWL